MGAIECRRKGSARSRARSISAAFALALVAAASLGAAPTKALVVGALKGSSGIGMARLIANPPTPPEGSPARLVLVPSADLMTAKLISGEYDAGPLT
jgi:NitT/TauT family transport system substrate-binding protein